MVKITEELIRKRSEHNEGEISTLEEIALHQEDIEAIEHLQHWCRGLKILLLQSNLISRLENLSKLKCLEYLNLAINNIERIENLEGCESLQKLDLTLNFIGDLTSVRSLRKNEFLQDLYLTGNPCTDYKGYREYVVASLAQLTSLDGKEIERSERIKALQVYDEIKGSIIAQQKEYRTKRLAQIDSKKGCVITEIEDDDEDENGEDKLKKYWSEISDNSPETRVEIARTIQKQNEAKISKPKNESYKRTYRLFNDNGLPMNINEAKIPFLLTEDDENNRLVLDVAVYKYLDTMYLNVDIQPTYVKILIKGKIFQIVFREEVKPDLSTAQRSQTTGHLVLSMPRVSEIIQSRVKTKKVSQADKVTPESTSGGNSRREMLEIGRGDCTSMDFSRIVEDAKKDRGQSQAKKTVKELQEDFVDDPNVPPLE